MKTTLYNIEADIPRELTIAHLSDLHGKRWDRVLEAVKEASPDIIAITGDFGKDRRSSDAEMISLFSALAKVAPTHFSLGNHEIGITDADIQRIAETGVTVLDDSYTETCGVVIGGLTSGFLHSGIGNGRGNPHLFGSPPPADGWLDKFESEEGYKILLCHHPEYFPTRLRYRKIDLVLSGHAHGGQIRLFGRGVIAPGQGFFPKYTSGVHENRLIISRGLANTAKIIPRLFNSTELVVIKLGKTY